MLTDKILKNHKIMLEIKNKVNAYLINELEEYIYNKLTEIACEAKDHDLYFSEVLNLFLNTIKLIDFDRAYTYLSQEKKDSILKFKPDSTDLDPESLVKLIETKTGYTDRRGTKNDTYIGFLIAGNKDKLTCQAKNSRAINTLSEIRDKINSYRNKNKKSIINEFNQGIDKLIKENNHDISDSNVINGLECLFGEIQKSENKYYHKFFFFNKLKQTHSSLQPKIKDAREIFAKFKCP